MTIAPDRQHRPLGKSGLTVSPVAWGMWRFAGAGVAKGRALIDAAIGAGITLFDTADIYGMREGGFGAAESLLGDVLKETPGLRARMVLATKGGIRPPVPYDSSAAYLHTALDASLARIGVEQIDLYQIHRPDILAHPHEVARAFEDMVTAGKVRAVGVSNFTAAQMDALAAFLTIPLASHQPEFSPLQLAPLDDGLLDHAMTHDIAVLAWSPLGGGRLINPEDERGRAVAPLLDRQAQAYGVAREAAAYSWVMSHPARVIPIAGTQNTDRLAVTADAFKVEWSRQDWYDVLVAARGTKLP